MVMVSHCGLLSLKCQLPLGYMAIATSILLQNVNWRITPLCRKMQDVGQHEY